MLKTSLILGTLLLILLPFSSYAEEPGVIGSNLGLDFYSRIDDAGDALAQGITRLRLREKGVYGSLGCGATWMSGERIDQRLLDELSVGNYSRLNILASFKKIRMTTSGLASLSQCLVDSYKTLQRAAHEDQDALEIVGNVGLYMDGDNSNSDYDIISDIARINTIIFKEKYDYIGTKNASAQAISKMLVGTSIAPLFPAPLSSAKTNTLASNSFTASSGGKKSGASSSLLPLPWAGICPANGSGSSESNNTLFGDGFFDELDSSFAGGGSEGGLVYIPKGAIPVTVSGSTSSSAFGLSQKNDFFHKPSCTGTFCITVNLIGGSQNLLGGFNNISIESLLEQHSNMMDPISWSDLTAQKMTNNSYQLPFLNIRFRDKIAGLRVYMHDAPQPKKILKTEDTPFTKDAVFDAAFKCAMNEAGLPGDEFLGNGFIGAGYVALRDTSNVPNKTLSLGPKEMDNLSGCYWIRMQTGKIEGYKGLSNDLSEFQAFTSSMMSIILQILETDRKLDTLPIK